MDVILLSMLFSDEIHQDMEEGGCIQDEMFDLWAFPT